MMLLSNIPQLLSVQLWAQGLNNPDEQYLRSFLRTHILTIACAGGALHGVAMAIRKRYGGGCEKYWLEWRWWAGVVVDGLAGFLLWPAMPFMSAHILIPLVIVIQLVTSYLLGLLMLGEVCGLQRNIGIIFAALGIIGVSLSTSHQAADFSIQQFWASWGASHFLVTNCAILIVLAGCFTYVHRATFWALAAGALEGVQYICSRSIATSFLDLDISVVKHPAVLAAISIKILCILGIYHFQQQGLDADLSRFAGIYLIACTVFMCVYGVAFFGDEMPISLVFSGSALCTLAGIWMLNTSEDCVSNESLAKDTEASNHSEA